MHMILHIRQKAEQNEGHIEVRNINERYSYMGDIVRSVADDPAARGRRGGVPLHSAPEPRRTGGASPWRPLGQRPVILG